MLSGKASSYILGAMEKLRINEKVMSKTLSGEEVLLDLFSGNYFGMNGVGTFLWKKIKQGASEDDLVKALSDAYDLDPKSAARDVRDFIKSLSKEKILHT
jgi:hypothetical protein